MLGSTVGRGQGQGDRETHKVDVADVRVELVTVERELGEAPVDVDVGVRGVGDRRFDQRRAWVQEKRQW